MSKTEMPSIRFHGFEDAWEQRKLGDLATEFKSGDNLKSDKITVIGKYPVYGGNGLRGYTDCFNHNGEFALIGRQGALCGNVNFSRGKAYFTEHAVAVKANSTNNTLFLYYMLGNMNLRQYSGQSAQPGLAVNKLVGLFSFVPGKDEQQQIGAFFYTLDNLITLHQRKFEKLTNVKKSMLEKMFPKDGADVPEVRFKGFTDAWEQRKFSDLVETRRGLTYKPTDIREKGVRVLRSSNIVEDRFVLKPDDVFVNESAINIDFAKENDILITAANGSSRLVGKHAIVSEISDKSTVHGGFMLLGTSDEPYFANAFMSSAWYKRFIDLYVSGGNGAIGNLNKSDLDDQDILVPQKKEQQAIGHFFENLDHLITLHQRELEKLQSIKKALLEKMFV